MFFRSRWPAPEVLLGDKHALIDGENGESFSYRPLVEGMERAAAALADAGLNPRDAVMIALPNSVCLRSAASQSEAQSSGPR